MGKILYKGYHIEAMPYQVARSMHWKMRIHIARIGTNGIPTKRFFAVNKFNTEKEATEHCFYFGKEIIDGKYPDCSLDDL